VRQATGGRRADAPAAPPSPPRVRELHQAMIEAVLAGDGLAGVAELASQAAGAPVALVVPDLGFETVVPAAAVDDDRRSALSQYGADRAGDRPVTVPGGVLAEAPIAAGDECLGVVLLLEGAAPPAADAGECLHLAAMAALTEAAISHAREEATGTLRGSLISDLRAGSPGEPRAVLRRARRLGCDLSAGAVVLCAELEVDRPRHVLAVVLGDHPSAVAEHLDGRVYAVLPPAGRTPGETFEAARGLAGRLERYGKVGLSSYCDDPRDLPRAFAEAELVLDVLRHAGGSTDADIGHGIYRLLFRVLASHPQEVRSFYEDTVAPLVAYDAQYSTDLVGTLTAYFEHDAKINATAAAIYAHRHTVAYRLERVRELTGLDPMRSEDAERLSLGLKSYRIISPQLPR
jgi:sugar diacid utilization regulator